MEKIVIGVYVITILTLKVSDLIGILPWAIV